MTDIPYLGTFFSHGTSVWPWPVIICESRYHISSKCEFPNFSSFPGLWLVVMVALPKNVLGGTFWQLHCRLHKLSNAQLNERKGCLEGEEEVTALNLI